MSTRPSIIKVALPVPLNRLFDYRLPASGPVPVPGARVTVPFGSRTLTGVVLELADRSEFPASKLKAARAVLDEAPVVSSELLALLRWAAGYYHHAIGEVFATALPASLRAGKPAVPDRLESWCLSPEGLLVDPNQLKRAPLQQQLLARLREAGAPVLREQLVELSDGWRAAIRAMSDKGWVEQRETAVDSSPNPRPQAGPGLHAAQQQAAQAINAAEGFEVFLLNGITGSGKTEVYQAAIDHQLAAGRQVLMLVPEIGLTPQLVSRVQQRIAQPVLALHSGLADSQRHNAWLQAATGEPLVVLGTRSAVFTPLPNLGLVIVDEEHDPSYKQQDGFRYHARDLAIMRASRKGVPAILGSATPSLESMHNARSDHYRMLRLDERAGGAELPAVGLIDLKNQPLNDGLSPGMIQAIGARLEKGEQSLLFLNRRGYAPVIMCRGCGWTQACPRCDAHMILHRQKHLLRCHHCGSETPLPPTCPACDAGELKPVGEGTERVEQALAKIFPAARIDRIDRDTTTRKGSLEQKLNDIHEGKVDIIVGTQMLAKGHDFPMITLVGVLNADQGLYSADFRGPEHLVQQVMQVSGRAGRAQHRGEVLIQTWHPEHPVYHALIAHDYDRFVETELQQRQQAGYPPVSCFALLRAESTDRAQALQFLARVAGVAASIAKDIDGVRVFDAVPASMEKRAGRFRAQLLLKSDRRPPLHRLLSLLLPQVEQIPEARKVRWSVDIDPVDMY